MVWRKFVNLVSFVDAGVLGGFELMPKLNLGFVDKAKSNNITMDLDILI